MPPTEFTYIFIYPVVEYALNSTEIQDQTLLSNDVNDADDPASVDVPAPLYNLKNPPVCLKLKSTVPEEFLKFNKRPARFVTCGLYANETNPSERALSSGKAISVVSTPPTKRYDPPPRLDSDLCGRGEAPVYPDIGFKIPAPVDATVLEDIGNPSRIRFAEPEIVYSVAAPEPDAVAVPGNSKPVWRTLAIKLFPLRNVKI